MKIVKDPRQLDLFHWDLTRPKLLALAVKWEASAKSQEENGWPNGAESLRICARELREAIK